MLNHYKEELSAQRFVPYLSHGTLASLEIWLRGRDLNPRPLGYEPNLTGQLRPTQTHSTRFY